MALMEMSSPLAAMSRPGAGFRSSMFQDTPFAPRLDFLADGRYFDADVTMETSPTSSLAADLSQNFYIDKTPAKPTPRRSLFLAFGDKTREVVTTPPLLPSSPSDMMDITISPLPHKLPFNKQPSRLTALSEFVSAARAPAVKPVETVEPAAVNSPCEMQRKISHDRKKSLSGRRPSLNRAKAYTTNMVLKTAGMSKLGYPSSGENKVFTFGSKKSSPVMALEEMFSASPEQKRVGLGLNMGGHKALLPSFDIDSSSSAGMSDSNGSPLAAASRRSLQRPVRKQACRRTMSMFDNAEEVIAPQAKLEASFCAQSPSQVAARESQILPCFSVPKDTLKRINTNTMVDLLDGKYMGLYDELKVIDCRFEYEYEGGHIGGAINVNSPENIDKLLLSMSAEAQPSPKKTLIVFHCEYSAHRAPRIALHLRSRDRQLNMHRYPELYYPEIYILEGGYSGFFSKHKERCEPQNYVEMDAQNHKTACERELGKFRRNTKFGRAQSYTFGAGPSASGESSPSVRGGKGSFSKLGGSTNYAMNGTLGRPRAENKRMASY